MKRPNLNLASIANFLRPSKSKPIFNKPVNTERGYRITRVVHITLLSVMVVLAMAIIGLKAMSLAFIEDNENTGFAFETGNVETITVLAALPRKLHTAPAKLGIVAGVVAFGVGIAHGGSIVWDWKKGKRTQSYAFRRNTMFLHFCNSILVLFSLVSTFVTHKSTSHFREGYIMRQADRSTNPNNRFFRPSDDGIRYNIGTFDLETWSCELKDVEGARSVWSEYERQCAIEMAGRIISVPFMVVSFLIAGACIAQMMRMRRDADGQRMKTDDVGLEMGKFNAL